jgi:hypothetical protein
MPDPLPTPRTPNKRRSRRQVAKSSTKAVVFRNALGVGNNIGQRVLDISETGVRLIVQEQMKVGQEFEMILQGPGSRPVKQLARIVWCVPSNDGTFCVGAAFQKPIPYSDLIALTRG